MRSVWSWGRVLTVSGVLAGVVAGCGSDDDDGSGIAKEMCDLYRPCCAEAGLSTEQRGCQLLFGAAVAGADKAAAQRCLDDMKQAAQAPDFCETSSSTPRPKSCEEAFPEQGDVGSRGTAKPGEPCEWDDDCASSPDGDVTCTFGSGPQFCQVLTRTPAGEACRGIVGEDFHFFSGGSSDASIPVCFLEDGLYCDDDSGQCQPISDLGGPCSNDYGCSEGYCESGTCSALLPPGSDCSGGSCDETSYCSVDDSICHPKVADGEPCESSEECDGLCVNDVCSESGSIGGSLGLVLLCQ